MPQPIDIAGMRVLVLGGSGVLGSAIARRLVEPGAQVMLAGRDATRLRQRASETGHDTPSVLFDLTVEGHARHVVSTTVDTLGGIDGVVNAAGVVAFGGLEELAPDVLDRLIATNFSGAVRVVQAALPHFDNGGFIVSISGLVAEVPMPGMAAYSGVKAALSATTTALGKELRRHNIHVMDARPPHTETGLADRPIAGQAPKLPPGLDPGHVADVIVSGLAAGRRELAAADFAASSSGEA